MFEHLGQWKVMELFKQFNHIYIVQRAIIHLDGVFCSHFHTFVICA